MIDRPAEGQSASIGPWAGISRGFGRAVLLALSAVAIASGPALAQSASSAALEAEGAINPAFVFNRICYSQVPNTQGIRNMALQLAWKPLDGEALKPFDTIPGAASVEGWDAQVGERVFRVALAQGPASPRLAETFPALADGTMTSCTMVLDGQDEADALYGELRALAGKEPASRDVEDGLLKTTTWAGGNDDVKVFLVMKADKADAGNLINVVVLTR